MMGVLVQTNLGSPLYTGSPKGGSTETEHVRL